ncbi:MAG: 50S ribosomal protein L6 [candidate division SR1 bacterium]|nr:50S ribosomal protein L6 [candidate division SR1 bacterium]
MSRIGKKIIEIPANVTVNYDKNLNKVSVNGNLGLLDLTLPSFCSLSINDNVLSITVKDENDKKQRSSWGTYRSLIDNLVIGVSKGFTREMELNGVGFKMELQGQNLTLYIGFSHTVKITTPDPIKLTLNKNIISGESIDKQMLGDFFMKIHNMKPCDVYKQKGFKIPNRYYRKKVGKKAK